MEILNIMTWNIMKKISMIWKKNNLTKNKESNKIKKYIKKKLFIIWKR